MRPRFCFGSVATEGWKPVSMIDRPDARVLDQEGDDRQLDRVLAIEQHLSHDRRLALRHRHELGRRVHVRADHRVQHDRRRPAARRASGLVSLLGSASAISLLVA